ncbi:MAG: hypothetical protein ABGZ17_04525, partial [Planctomycetaceae bacterium]
MHRFLKTPTVHFLQNAETVTAHVAVAAEAAACVVNILACIEPVSSFSTYDAWMATTVEVICRDIRMVNQD